MSYVQTLIFFFFTIVTYKCITNIRSEWLKDAYNARKASVIGMRELRGEAQTHLKRLPPGGAHSAVSLLPQSRRWIWILVSSAVFSSSPPLCCDRLSQSVSHTHPGTPHPHPSSFPPPSHPTLPHPPPPPLLLLASEKTTEWESMAQRPAWQDNKPQRRGEFFFPLLVVFFELRN